MGGVQGIPLSAIERYLRFWPEHDPIYFAEVIMRIDDLWVDSTRKRLESQKNAR